MAKPLLTIRVGIKVFIPESQITIHLLRNHSRAHAGHVGGILLVVPIADSRQKRLDPARMKFAVLRVLAETGKVTLASQACGWQDTSTVQKARREDEDFAADWEIALLAASNKLEAEAWRRAEEGVLEPTYYKGEIVGYTTKYSDPLMMFMLRKLNPAYRDTGRSGDTNINFGIAVLPMTAVNDEDWEQRAQVMHNQQRVITLEAKPVENNLARVQRGD